jgi:hypothetical protein
MSKISAFVGLILVSTVITLLTWQGSFGFVLPSKQGLHPKINIPSEVRKPSKYPHPQYFFSSVNSDDSPDCPSRRPTFRCHNTRSFSP